MRPGIDAADTLAEVLKCEGPRVLATLARTIGDLAVAEDALSEATITALDAWRKNGDPLARLLAGLMPDEPKALSLLALLLLTSARTCARTDADGNPVTLAAQDRTRWNRVAIAEGSAWLFEAVARSGGVARPYQIQAHLAAAHSTAPSWQETDWGRIIGLYDLLGPITANPVVALNRAVAVAEHNGPEAGLAALKAIVGLEYSHLWHAALADNLRRLGRTSKAAGELRTAVTLASSEVERRLLQGCLRAVRSELG